MTAIQQKTTTAEPKKRRRRNEAKQALFDRPLWTILNDPDIKAFTTGEAAGFCRMAPRTMAKLFDSGRVSGYRIPGSQDRRIHREELKRFMLENNMIPKSEMELQKVALIGFQQDFLSTIARLFVSKDCEIVKVPELCLRITQFSHIVLHGSVGVSCVRDLCDEFSRLNPVPKIYVVSGDDYDAEYPCPVLLESQTLTQWRNIVAGEHPDGKEGAAEVPA